MNKETRQEEQLSALIDSYQNLVFSICYKITSDYFASEDMTQETFLSAYQHLNSFDGENAKAWICRIATNKCLDYMKKASNRNIPTDDDDMEKAFIFAKSTDDGLESSILEKEVRDTLLKRCNSLKKPYDEIAKLYYYDELDAKEIALRRGMNLKSVQTQIYRARAMLRKMYDPVKEVM